MTKHIKTALVVEGGAMRSIFSAGLLDGFIARQFNPFDVHIGVSAGAYNLLCYLTGEQNKSRHIFEDFACSRHFINIARFLRGGDLIDLDWLEHIAFDDSHLDVQSAYQHNTAFYVTLSDVYSGQPVYVKTQANNVRQLIKASAALPLLYRNFPQINGRPVADGGVADGIPVAEAMRLGARKIMVIRARPERYIKKDSIGHWFIRWNTCRHPALKATMKRRTQIFDDSLSLIRKPPEGIRIIEICPPEKFTLGRFERNRDKLNDGYELGYQLADNAMQRWHAIESI